MCAQRTGWKREPEFSKPDGIMLAAAAGLRHSRISDEIISQFLVVNGAINDKLGRFWTIKQELIFYAKDACRADYPPGRAV